MTEDPINLLRGFRADVALPSATSAAAAREAMLAGRPRRPKRPLIAVAASVLALVVVAATTIPWSSPQSAAAAVDALAQTARAQKAVVLKPDDWITTRYTTKRSWTQELTQEKLDRLTARAVAATAAANASGHYMGADGRPLPAAELAKISRANQRTLDRIRAGVRLADLPTTHVTAWNISSYTSSRNARGLGGGGGGGSNTVEYGSPEQKRSGLILQRARIGGRAADPTDFGGFEIADLPNQVIADEADVARLSAVPAAMRAELTSWKQAAALPGKVRRGSTLDLFTKGTGVVGSPYAAPAQRAAAIRMIAMLPGVTIEREAEDATGRDGLGMSIAIDGGEMQIVFDEGDSRLLGMQVKIDDPEGFVGDSYAGSGKHRVAVVPPFDSATLAVSYRAAEISRGGPPCTPESCLVMPGESLQRSQERVNEAVKSRLKAAAGSR